MIKTLLLILSAGSSHGYNSGITLIEVPEGIEVCKQLGPVIAQQFVAMTERDYDVKWLCQDVTVVIPNHEHTEGK